MKMALARLIDSGLAWLGFSHVFIRCFDLGAVSVCLSPATHPCDSGEHFFSSFSLYWLGRNRLGKEGMEERKGLIFSRLFPTASAVVD